MQNQAEHANQNVQKLEPQLALLQWFASRSDQPESIDIHKGSGNIPDQFDIHKLLPQEHNTWMQLALHQGKVIIMFKATLLKLAVEV